ncbi:MAG: hypothetical protein NTZ48_00220 [Candidatus Omnitrophica bacterium]|nr:hypothetical protein [Candidatus Omnitrophota bacterium]
MSDNTNLVAEAAKITNTPAVTTTSAKKKRGRPRKDGSLVKQYSGMGADELYRAFKFYKDIAFDLYESDNICKLFVTQKHFIFTNNDIIALVKHPPLNNNVFLNIHNLHLGSIASFLLEHKTDPVRLVQNGPYTISFVCNENEIKTIKGQPVYDIRDYSIGSTIRQFEQSGGLICDKTQITNVPTYHGREWHSESDYEQILFVKEPQESMITMSGLTYDSDYDEESGTDWVKEHLSPLCVINDLTAYKTTPYNCEIRIKHRLFDLVNKYMGDDAYTFKFTSDALVINSNKGERNIILK